MEYSPQGFCNHTISCPQARTHSFRKNFRSFSFCDNCQLISRLFTFESCFASLCDSTSSRDWLKRSVLDWMIGWTSIRTLGEPCTVVHTDTGQEKRLGTKKLLPSWGRERTWWLWPYGCAARRKYSEYYILRLFWPKLFTFSSLSLVDGSFLRLGLMNRRGRDDFWLISG